MSRHIRIIDGWLTLASVLKDPFHIHYHSILNISVTLMYNECNSRNKFKFTLCLF